MSHDSEKTLLAVLHSMRDTSVSAESLSRSLERARRIEASPDASYAMQVFPRAHRAQWLSSCLVSMYGRVAAMLLVAVGAVFVGWMLLGGNERLAYAQLHEVMSKLESVHLVIDSPHGAKNDPEDSRVEVWYRRGVGFAMHSPFGWEVDDGAYLVKYYRSWRLAIRSPSRIADEELSDARHLGQIMDFHVEEMPADLPRLEGSDVVVDGNALRAYVWNLPELPKVEMEVLPEELWPQRRVLFLLEESDRLRRCVHERGLDGKWKAYRSVDISYPAEIPAQRFVAQLAPDVRVVDANDEGLEVDPEVRLLVAGIQRRQKAYLGLQFAYDASLETKPSPESQLPASDDAFTDGVLQTRDVLALLPPEEPRADRPWRRWVQEKQDAHGHWNLHQYSAFDGVQTQFFWIHRSEWTKRGFANTGEYWGRWSQNYFDAHLFLQLNGGNDTYPQTDELRELHLDRFHVVGRRQAGEREVVTLHGSSTPEFGVEYEVEMTTEPDYLILRWEARYSRKDGALLMRYLTTRVGQFEGVSYPAEGTFRQMGIGELPDVQYSFRVSRVERLEDAARETWFPDWPAGTRVNDRVNERVFDVPWLRIPWLQDR